MIILRLYFSVSWHLSLYVGLLFLYFKWLSPLWMKIWLLQLWLTFPYGFYLWEEIIRTSPYRKVSGLTLIDAAWASCSPWNQWIYAKAGVLQYAWIPCPSVEWGNGVSPTWAIRAISYKWNASLNSKNTTQCMSTMSDRAIPSVPAVLLHIDKVAVISSI